MSKRKPDEVSLNLFLRVLKIDNAPAEAAMLSAGYHDVEIIVLGPPTKQNLNTWGFTVAEQNRIIKAINPVTPCPTTHRARIENGELILYFDVPAFFSGIYHYICNLFHHKEKKQFDDNSYIQHLIDSEPLDERTGNCFINDKKDKGRKKKFKQD